MFVNFDIQNFVYDFIDVWLSIMMQQMNVSNNKH